VAAARRRLAGDERRTGVLVAEAVPDGPVARAGLRLRDVVVGIGGQSVSSVDDLHRFLGEHPVGTFTVQAIRDGKPVELAVQPKEPPP
jgi:serine protease Do